MQTIWDKLSSFRKNTEERAEKLLSELQEDKWIEKELLTSLADASHEMQELQESLLHTLSAHDIQAAPTVCETYDAVNAWERKELAKSIALEIGEVLKKVASLSYEGTEESIIADLEKIREEARSLLKDLEHYEKHQERIDAFKQLLSWVETGKPLGFAEGTLCMKAFGYNLYFAINTKQLQLGTYEEENAAPAEMEPSISVPECAFYHGELIIDALPVKQKLFKSATKFKNEMESMVSPKTSKAIDVLNLLIGHIVLLPEYYESLCVPSRAKALFETLLEQVYQAGLARKISYYDAAGYILNRDLISYYKNDSYKRVLRYKSDSMLQEDEDISDVRYVRTLITLHMLNGMRKLYGNFGAHFDDEDEKNLGCCTAMFSISLSGDTPIHVGLMIPIFTKEHLSEEMKDIKAFLKKAEEEEATVLICITNEEEKAFWDKTLADYHIFRVFYSPVGTEFAEKFTTDELKKIFAYYEEEHKKQIESQTSQPEEEESKVEAETEDVWEPVKEEAQAEIPAHFSNDSDKAEEKTAPEPMKEEASAEILPELSDEAEEETVTKPIKAEESAEISTERSDEAEEETVPETVKEEDPAEIPAALSPKARGKSTPEPVKQENTTEILANLSSEADKEPLGDMLTTIAREIRKHHIAEGMLMLHGLAMQKEEDWAYRLLSEVSYVLDDPLYSHITHKEDAYKYWDYTLDIPTMDAGSARDYLNAAAMIRYFFKPSHGGGNWHWQTNQVWKQISDDSSNTALQAIPEIKQVISCFYRFLDKNKRGLGWCLGSTGRLQERYEQDMALCHNELTALSQRLQHRKIKRHYYPRIIKTYEQICKGSDLYLYVSMPEEASAEEILTYVNRFSDEAKSADEIISDEELGYTVSGDKLDAWMDKVWDSIEVDRKQTDHFTGAARSSLKSLLVCAFEALGKYVFTRLRMESKKEAQIEASVVKKTVEEATGLCTELIGRLPKIDSENAVNPLLEISICSLKYLVKALLKSFNSNYRPMEFYEPFLLTNYVELNEHYVPLMDFDYQLAGLSLYKRCLMHVKEIEEGKLDPSEISSYECSREYSKKHMNMGFYKLLSHRLGMEDVGIKEEEIDSKGENYLKKEMENFRSELELSYNYGRLTQKNEIESYERLGELLLNHLMETQNFGLFTLFTAACKERIDKDSQPRKEDLEKQFASLKEMLAQKMDDTHELLSDYPILDEIRKCLENRNFNVAEDYMRQCQDGNLTEIKNLFNNELDDFKHFMESYQEYYNICSKNARVNLDKTLDSWLSYKRKSRSSLSKNAIGRDQIAFLQQWDRLLPSVGKVPPELFLEMLGYPKPSDVSVDKQTNNRPVYDVSFKGERVHKNSHPFKQFGSGIYEEGLKVITFTGAHTPETIMKELTDAGVERAKGTICLLDASMKWADRCELAKLMKCNETMYNVIVIDRVMALYLSQFPKLERENKMMRLCMPFANATPFLSRGFIPPEMFIGRTKELADIRNMEGPNLVYGGRQLGKSILLRQVSFLDNQPAKEHYAFYFDMKDKNEARVLETISKELKKAKLLDHTLTDWDDFADSMDTVMEKAQQLILLIDEADAFILSSGKVKDRPIEVLRVTQNKFLGHFKFVLAGLHNVIRYDKGSLSANTVYGQLGHINIRPFEYADACDLLLRPLSYLGFTIPEPEIVSTILAKTNYFPGLIQYYGMKILESAKTAYRKNNFKSTENPPYVLNESYLKHLMEDDSFLKEIEDKFMITLRVDKYDDNLYYLLTLGVAYLYAAEDKPVTLNKIKDTLSGTRIKNLTDDKLSALLDELEELNVLRKVNDSEYIFNRYSFYSMLGGAEKVEKALMEYADNELV